MGRAGLVLFWPLAFVDNARSSGARQRIEPLPNGTGVLAESTSPVIDETPKSVRRGTPLGPIKTFGCLSSLVDWRMETGMKSYAL